MKEHVKTVILVIFFVVIGLDIYQKKFKPVDELQPFKYIASPYEILGVSREFKSVELMMAFEKLQEKFHPNLHINKSHEDLEKIKLTYHKVVDSFYLLSDPEKRKQFDAVEQLVFIAILVFNGLAIGSYWLISKCCARNNSTN